MDPQFKYEKLVENDKKPARSPARRFWSRRPNGRVKGLKLSRCRKLSWRPFVITTVLSRKIHKICADFVERMKSDEACPAILFSCQWGLPVLSHSSVKSSRKN
ncbi:Unknown protein [Striga hermonthica]|uniref:Uncharacterized protein n=1 Tax=Striga hermonthica TaxID=68872 RepID=A0A9N7R0B4_STRHE|nr:Unknown protein [Striga hermonthica]